MPDELQIRLIRPEEFGAAGELTMDAYREFAPARSSEWTEYLTRIGDIAGRAGHTTILVALLDGSIAGTATLELEQRVETDRDPPEPDEAHLRMLGVAPDLRRRGIARRLVEACIDEARRRGRSRLTLETTERMLAAQALYRAMGFRFVGSREVAPGLVFQDYELLIAAQEPDPALPAAT